MEKSEGAEERVMKISEEVVKISKEVGGGQLGPVGPWTMRRDQSQ